MKIKFDIELLSGAVGTTAATAATRFVPNTDGTFTLRYHIDYSKLEDDSLWDTGVYSLLADLIPPALVGSGFSFNPTTAAGRTPNNSCVVTATYTPSDTWNHTTTLSILEDTLELILISTGLPPVPAIKNLPDSLVSEINMIPGTTLVALPATDIPLTVVMSFSETVDGNISILNEADLFESTNCAVNTITKVDDHYEIKVTPDRVGPFMTESERPTLALKNFRIRDYSDPEETLVTQDYMLEATNPITVKWDPFSFIIMSAESIPGVLSQPEFKHRISLNKIVSLTIGNQDKVLINPTSLALTNCSFIRAEKGEDDASNELTLVFKSTVSGASSVTIKPGFITDLLGNTNETDYILTPIDYQSNELFQQKKNVYESGFDYTGHDNTDIAEMLFATDGVIGPIPLGNIEALGKAASVVDCARTLPQRLVAIAATKALEQLQNLVTNNQNAQSALATLQSVYTTLSSAYQIYQTIMSVIENPVPFLRHIAEAQGLTGAALGAKLDEIATKFANVSGIDKMLDNIMNLDICKMQNFGPMGNIIPSPAMSPMQAPGMVSVNSGAGWFDDTNRIEYNALMGRLTNCFDNAKTIDSGRFSSKIAEIAALSHQDMVDGKSKHLCKSLFDQRVQTEIQMNGSVWGEEKTNQFKSLSNESFTHLDSRRDDIFKHVNTISDTGTGWAPMRGTWYGNASIDKTTASEIASGKLQWKDQFFGSSGKGLLRKYSVASNYFKAGTKLNVKFADGTPWGFVEVMDTGGMSKNVIDFYCGDDKDLANEIAKRDEKVQGTKPLWTAPILVQIVSGGPK